MSTSIFVRIDSIKGESRERGHEDEIEAVSWSWGVAQATGAGAAGRGAGRVGRPTFSEFTFAHHLDAASPLLLKACATGQRVPKARVTVRRAGHGQHDFLVIDLTEVGVASVATAIDTNATHEVVVLTFAKVSLDYVPQGADGRPEPAIRFTHDLRTR
ncbi:Hcp family type VI secretion system effector [Knoellia subterranea]|uniref:Type VI secretion protein n=1 Tax=Knoellia subterranea KCTC 19937 TaxID=1385521 RepID=A0A0A0JLF8_9MICO|nr:type VI secretion system tube protein Hcp [Knoellia subterranea]KGN38290.1 hypothetical protein N803_11155 [Knoellia subterranea KCTC 19937]